MNELTPGHWLIKTTRVPSFGKSCAYCHRTTGKRLTDTMLRLEIQRRFIGYYCSRDHVSVAINNLRQQVNPDYGPTPRT